MPFDSTRPPGLGPVLLVNFIGTLGFTIAIPFMVYLVSRFGGNALVYGIVSATYSSFQFVGTDPRSLVGPLRPTTHPAAELGWNAGVVAHVRRSPLPAGDGIGVVEDLRHDLVTLALSILVLIMARALVGLKGGNISVANVCVADVSSETDRSRNFGRMGVAANLDMVLGPALAGILGATVLEVLRQPSVAYLVVLLFVINMSFSFFYTVFPMHAAVDLWSVSEMGIFFAVLSLLLVLTQGPMLSHLARRVSEPWLISGGLLL
ncbi:MAG: hypothetical protein VYD18_06335, partial [Candidatus Latescibacterota bacterium]|nr:hypothetical protein [Candidatus Latescibacterota bacterium]